MFARIGDSFTKMLTAASEIQKMAELYNQVKSMITFMEHYRLTLNLYRFIPTMDVAVPDDEMGDASAYVVGFFPKSNNGWGQRSLLYGDNPYYRGGGGMRLVEVRYPKSLDDLTLDIGVWGGTDDTVEEFQQKLLAGFYDGVVSAGTYMNNIGVGNNMKAQAMSLSPSRMAQRRADAILERIVALQNRKAFMDQALSDPSSDAYRLTKGMTPDQKLAQILALDQEVADLQQKLASLTPNEVARQNPWMEQANFIHQVLAKLEAPERRLAIAKLSERYKKYEKAWNNPDFMNPTPDITGNEAVDNAIYLIWQAATLMSWGKIAPPTPVSGGPAAEAQATITKSMYRQFLMEELAGVRRLLSHEFQNQQQAKGAETVDEGRRIVERSILDLQAGADRIRRLQTTADARQKLLDTGFGGYL